MMDRIETLAVIFSATIIALASFGLALWGPPEIHDPALMIGSGISGGLVKAMPDLSKRSPSP